MRRTTQILAAHGVTQRRVAEEAGYSMRGLGNGRYSGSNLVSDYLGGHRHMTDRVRQAIRRLLPKEDADLVIALADEAWGGRHDG
jgi:hypothetical protein